MNDQKYMRECIRLARKGSGAAHPNPMVGALLVRGKKVIARGYHRRFGGLHAEVECLARAKGDLSNATLYVNLEPCSHFGKTPPCVDRIIEAGVGRVVAAIQDPNPLVSGRGFRALRKRGIQVTTGVLREEAIALNRPFVVSMRKKRPFVHLKVAQSLDGFIAPVGPRRLWLTSPDSRRLVHRWRSEHDALLVGAGTIAVDDPELNVRLTEGRNPLVVVLDGSLSIKSSAKVLQTGSRIFVLTTVNSLRHRARRAEDLADRGAIVLGLPSRRGRIPLPAVLSVLYRHGMRSVMVEGGCEVFSQFLKANLVDHISLFVAPKVLGAGVPFVFPDRSQGNRRRKRASDLKVCERVGGDALIQYEFHS